ncbi:MAG: TPM domain-containing protein [Roseofilum sp. SBFL]|uniref:photosystem II repair protein Psb32 n=1 Tax=unclassified Roseofilum TaxID=2620099 RepID=UPI001B2D9D01|nr:MULTISPECIES: TPM domain-containing protein [unclassified Roseofilum]MBP0015553.1 TPM domain-containing protein [Roseofilum sp. SID3]MBP0022439.1 TPM domain-containing protein [Roseofilum sp. SID2]MBP0036737.1 TPM domain-containing protein [Roseofilum sp. SID1]MBP0042245.1 TPM domain-containing protein [Roseofilum sp. SBFL]
MKTTVRGLLISILALLLGWMNPQLAEATGVYQMPVVEAGEATWIVDRADVISRLNEGKLSKQFSELSEETGNEVRLVTIRRLDYGETIDSFTHDLFEKWFPTVEEQRNQVLLVLDVVTNNSAIQTGEETQDLLSDEMAESVSSETVQVPLRSGDRYNRAFLGAGDRLTAILSGNPDPGPPLVEDTIQAESTFASAEETKNSNAMVWVAVLLILATVIPMVTYFWLYS